MSNLIQLFKTKELFTLASARDILPLVIKITKKYKDEINQLLVTQTNSHPDSITYQTHQNAVNAKVLEWQTKIAKLGAEGKGLWLVDFDCGTGYYCWKFPEDSLEYFHNYTEGFLSRRKIII